MTASTVFMCFGCTLLLLTWQTETEAWINPHGQEGEMRTLQQTLGVIIRLILPAPLLLWCLGAFTFVGALSFFHMYLCIIGRTTAEWMRLQLPLEHTDLLRQRWTHCVAALTSLCKLDGCLPSVRSEIETMPEAALQSQTHSATTSSPTSPTATEPATATATASPLHVVGSTRENAPLVSTTRTNTGPYPSAALLLSHNWASEEPRLLPMAYPPSVCDEVLQLEIMLLNLHAIIEKLRLKQASGAHQLEGSERR